jgi:hypothetical protein
MDFGVSQSGYEGGAGVIAWLPGGDGELFIKVFNDSDAAYTNGGVYGLSFKNDSDSNGFYPILESPTTDTDALHWIVVVNNSPLGKATIADDAWGYVQLKGYCPAITVNTTVTLDHYMELITATAYATDDGTTKTTGSFGIAKSTSATSVTGILFGERVVVEAS